MTAHHSDKRKRANDRHGKKARTNLVLALICLLSFLAHPWPSSAITEIPEPSLKIPPMVPEDSVSTYVPSQSAPGKGLAVNIIYPKKPRYPDGAPVAVVAPGGAAADGLSFEMHAAQVGFIEVRFAFPGGRHGRFNSSGFYDYRGINSQMALRDVLLFAAGKITDSEGRKIYDLVPVKISKDNIGLVGWSNGGNVALVTMYRYADQLPFIAWIGFYESPLGSMFFPPNLGGEHDLVYNKHYRQGSCATGDCLVDYRNLRYDPYIYRTPGEHQKRGESEIPGVIFFDENGNKKWDESIEFAFSWASDVGLDKQIYPPDVTAALERSLVFVEDVRITPKRRIVKPAPGGLQAVLLPKDPDTIPIDPLASPDRITSMSVSAATDKFAYAIDRPAIIPPAARTRKYYFRPLSPLQEAMVKRVENGLKPEPTQEELNKARGNAITVSETTSGEVQKKAAGNSDSTKIASADDAADNSESTKIASTDAIADNGQSVNQSSNKMGGAYTAADNDQSAEASASANPTTAQTSSASSSASGQAAAGSGQSTSAKTNSSSGSTQANSSGQPLSAGWPKPVIALSPSTKYHMRHPIATVAPKPHRHVDPAIYKKMVAWPDCIATLKESEAYFEERDGSLYIAKVAEKYPNLLVLVFASEVDHLQRQPDHPHIALQYNAWLSNKVRWLRLNPDRMYMAAVSGMNKGNFKNNQPGSPIDASEIALFLENEGVVPDYVYMEGVIAELADRKRTKNLHGSLTDVLCSYNNGSMPTPPATAAKK